jgi:hypothetical protein
VSGANCLTGGVTTQVCSPEYTQRDTGGESAPLGLPGDSAGVNSDV